MAKDDVRIIQEFPSQRSQRASPPRGNPNSKELSGLTMPSGEPLEYFVEERINWIIDDLKSRDFDHAYEHLMELRGAARQLGWMRK